MMIPVELVGGEFDGLQFDARRGVPELCVPLAFGYAADGSLERVESLIYGDLGRSSAEGRRLFGFESHVSADVRPPSAAGDHPPV